MIDPTAHSRRWTRASIEALLVWLTLCTSAFGIALTFSVDVSSARNPCVAIQAALKSAVDAGNGIQIVKIRGNGSIRYSDLQDHGDYKLCFGLVPSEKQRPKSSFPDLIMTDEETMISVEFDNVDLRFDPTGQDSPVVIAQWGDFYHRGWEKERPNTFSIDGFIEGGVRISGRLVIETLAALSGDWPMGRIPGLPFGGSTSSPTTVVGWFETGLLRADLTTLSLTLLGSKGDADDIGLLHQHGWGIYRGHVRVAGWGVGVLFYGNAIGDISSGYISRNGIGMSFGDPWIGADVAPSPNCLRGKLKNDPRFCEVRNQSVKETAIRSMVIEGNNYGNLIIFDGEQLHFDTIHFETGKPRAQKGHSVLIGGGACQMPSDRVGLPCGEDADCGTGICRAPAKSRARSIRFNAGSIGGDRYSNEWDGLFLGPGALGSGRSDDLILSTKVVLNNVSRAPNPIKKCGLPGIQCALFGYNPKATLGVDASLCHFERRNMSKPSYRDLILPGS